MRKCLNQYCPTRQIASKPSGSVYLAYHASNVSQEVTLETFDATCCTFDQPTENFLQQVGRIKQLRHSSIVPILDLGIEQGQAYVVRKYLGNDSLRDRLDYLLPQRLSLQEALTIIFQVGQVLCYAHGHDVLHGNLKPETIFFNGNGEILLSDFGLANFIDVTKLFHKSDVQTLSYIAPEQFVGSISRQSDQYALACLAYELITGHVPFSTQSFSSIVSFPPVDGESERAIEGKGSADTNEAVLDQIGSFCKNSQCPDYGKIGRGNIRKYGKTRRGEQRWQCKTCQMTWSSSSLSAKHGTTLPVLPSDLVPSLPRAIEEAVLKAMAKDPSERYASVALFLRALQTTSLLPLSMVSGHPLTTASFSTFVTTAAKPFETMGSEVPPATRLLERSEHVHNEYSESKAAMTPAGETYVEALPQARRSHPGKPLPPSLWLAFALSGLIVLLGTVILYALVPLRSPGSPNSGKSLPTAQPSVQATHSLPVTPIPTVIATPPPPTSYEAEATQNTLANGARVIGCPGGVCSGGDRVGYIGLNAGLVGTLQFNNVNKNVSGPYTLTIYYIIAGSDKLALYISVNGGSEVVLNVSQTANGDAVGTASITVNLSVGKNTIRFSNPSVPAPDIDRIVI